jgi:hypothetical protein
MPWVKVHPILAACKAARNFHALFRLAPTEALSHVVGHLKKISNDWFPNRGPQTPDQRSRGAARPTQW